MVAMLSSKMMRCLSGVVVLVCFCSARPSQHERLIKTASAFALDSDSPVKLPESQGTGQKDDQIPVHLYYGVPAVVQQVEESAFRKGREMESSKTDLENGVKRRIQHYQQVVKPPEQDGTVWSALTNIIEYGQVEKRSKRSITRRKVSGDGLNILRLKVGRGGVAIAGPGGVASAGTGGTAIVGPGGSAFTEADGTAVVGPGAKLYHIPSDFMARARSGKPVYKLIATGPFVFQPSPRSVEPAAFF